ncbi:MAG: fused MFS/spermidine synthase [Bifidobacteriaceae bacterium]|nr:fused MFS/spermidine synthase [Bifidobacteriaceae bacterium]
MIRHQPPLPTEPFAIDHGTAFFLEAGDSVTLYINGVPSSQWSMSDPAELDFEYMRWIMATIETTFTPDAPLRALHLGAAACALPHAIVRRFPYSRHLAVELDAALAAAVRRYVALPRAPVLRIRVDDAARTLRARPPASHHLIVRDAFDDGPATPPELRDDQAARAAAAALRPDGLFVANCADTPGLPLSRDDLRTLATHFAYVGFITEPAQLHGRRRGNVVLLARHTPLTQVQEDRLAHRLRVAAFPTRLIAGPEALSWAGCTAPGEPA